MTTIKHWGRRYNAAEENICSEQGCYTGAVDFDDRGRAKCSRHLTFSLRMEVTRGRSEEFTRPRAMSDIRRVDISH